MSEPRYPKIGEWWYVKIAVNDIWLCKCVGIVGETSIMCYRYLNEANRIKSTTFSKVVHSNNSSKWEPNWFQKLLGYK